MKKQQTKAFTLVELIIVITILAILATIGFMSYQSYTSDARDGKRKRDLASIRSGLETYQAKKATLPMPDNYATLSSGTTIGYQGYAGTSILSLIRAGDSFQDPSDKSYYTYGIDTNKTKYQLLAMLEINTNATSYNNKNILNQTYAVDYTNRYSHTLGKGIGIYLSGTTKSPVQEGNSGTTLAVNTANISVVTNNNSNVSGGLSNGACGTAAKTYSYSDSSFGSDTFCSVGSLSGGINPSFPGIGSSVTWYCNSIGGTNINCNANKLSYLKPQEVFSSYAYVGNGADNTITNSIDFLNYGGLIWTKNRNSTGDNWLNYSISTPVSSWANLKILNSNNGNIEWYTGAGIDKGTNLGFHIFGGAYDVNYNLANYSSWTFRKAPKFFDIVTYTGNGISNNKIVHSLGIKPSLVIIKNKGTRADWGVWSQALYNNNTSNDSMLFNTTASTSSYIVGEGIENSTSTGLNLNGQLTAGVSNNYNGENYVAYLFANDTSTNGIIQTGLFTTDASGNANISTIGWEPQYIMMKSSSTTGNWIILDQTRGWGAGNDKALFANTSGTETNTTDYGSPNSTGFTTSGLSASSNYLYMVIRKAY